MNSRVISPPLTAFEHLRQPLTPGERQVFEIFNTCLPKDWEIYVQPHLNGLRPDFVLLHPNGAIGVFEVKDWDLNAMSYFIRKNENGDNSLWAQKDGQEFCLQNQNPINKVNLYKREIFDLYCPRLQKGNGWAAITAGVIFPFAPIHQIRQLFKPFLKTISNSNHQKYQPISGMEAVFSRDLEVIFPDSKRKTSIVMSEDHARDLRGWLTEPDFAAQQRTPLVLDRNQRFFAETRTESGYRRIKGPAGSGKSLVLAARAARLANEGKSVLVATFNITLWHYLRDMIVRNLEAPHLINNIKFTHFHLWCKHTCLDAGWEQRYNDLLNEYSPQYVLDEALPALAQDAVNEPGAARYDAILVDEGQDYRPFWWNVLRQACELKGEMLLVADATQDVYGTAKSWTDDVMKGAGFPGGRWAQLHISYRLPPDALNLARTFAEEFLPKEVIDLPEQEQGSLNLYPCHLRWVQCLPEDAEKICSDEILSMMRKTGENGLANADITMLVSNMKSGACVTRKLSEYRINSVDTFSDDKQESRRKKMGFYMGDARLKATTLHSFKGWETRLLVVYITEAAHIESLALIYAGLTRLKRSQHGSWLTVICTAPELNLYGRSFPDYSDKINVETISIQRDTITKSKQ